jgi:hypothetical protein
MSAADISKIAIAALCCVCCVALMPRVWRGWFAEEVYRHDGSKVMRGDLVLPWWPFSEASRRGVIRGLAAAIAAVWCILLAWVTAIIGENPNGALSHVMHTGAIIFLAGFAVFFVLHFMVVFFNRPKLIVPPSQRDEVGLLEKRRAL